MLNGIRARYSKLRTRSQDELGRGFRLSEQIPPPRHHDLTRRLGHPVGAKVSRPQRLARHPESTATRWMGIFFVFAELIARGEDFLAQLAFMGDTLMIPEWWSLSTNGSHVTVRLV